MKDNLNLNTAGAEQFSALVRYPWCNQPIIWFDTWSSMNKDTDNHYKLNK